MRGLVLCLGAVILVSACSSDPTRAPSLVDSERVVEILRTHPVASLMRPSSIITIEKSHGNFRYGGSSKSEIKLPSTANGDVSLSSDRGTFDLRALGAKSVGGSISSGNAVVYPDAYGAGIASVHMPSGRGDDELIVFERKPAASRMEYEIQTGRGTDSARIVDNSIQLGSRGRLSWQMAAPYLFGYDGARFPVRVAMEGCARVHGGRTAGARCRISLDWSDAANVIYPAVLDPLWTPTGDLGTARTNHTATTLSDGRVLVAGGVDSSGSYLSSTEIYDPAAGIWRASGSLSNARAFHIASLLPTGLVLAAGGGNATTELLTSSELFDPSTETWTSTGSMGTGRQRHAAAETTNYGVLVSGGIYSPGSRSANATAEIYDFLSGSWSTVGSMTQTRKLHQLTSLGGGLVLASGGLDAATRRASLDVYDPSSATWSSVATLSNARSQHSATQLRDGRVLIAGGSLNFSSSTATVEIFDPSTDTVSDGPDMQLSRVAHAATILPSGNVLVVGGSCLTEECDETSEEYNPSTNAWESLRYLEGNAPPLQSATASSLGNGWVLIAGGDDPTTSAPYDTSALYNPSPCLPPGAGGYISGGIQAAPTDVVLTSTGASDWSHPLRDGNTEHKNVTSLITPPSSIGSGTSSFQTGASTFSWSDGSYVTTGSDSDEKTYSGAAGDGFSITAPADLQWRTLNIYLGAYSGSGQIIAQLGDNSCSMYQATISADTQLVTITYFTTSPSQTLYVSFALTGSGTLDYGAAALSPASLPLTSFEGDTNPFGTTHVTPWDNPLSAGNPVTLQDVFSEQLGSNVAQEIDARDLFTVEDDPNLVPGFLNSNLDLLFHASAGDASPDGNDLVAGTSGTWPAGINDTTFAWPPPPLGNPGTFTFNADTNPSLTVQAEGIRLGYSPMDISLETVAPDLSSTSASLGTLVLDPSVDLVPIQVAVMYSNGGEYAGTSGHTLNPDTSLAEQLLFFDRILQPNTTTSSDGDGELTSVSRTWSPPLSWLYTNQPSSLSGVPFYEFRSTVTPDSALASCSVQFRLVNFATVLTDNKHVLPVQGPSGTSVEDPNLFTPDEIDGTWCDDNFDLVMGESHSPPVPITGVNGQFIENIPTLIFMAREGYPQTNEEEGRALYGENAACVSFHAGGTTISHEIGHLSGLDDCTVGPTNPSCQLMNSLGSGSIPPSSSECSSISTWAHALSTSAFPR